MHFDKRTQSLKKHRLLEEKVVFTEPLFGPKFVLLNYIRKADIAAHVRRELVEQWAYTGSFWMNAIL